MLDRIAIAAALREIGALLALQGGKQHQARAYEKGARALEALNADLGELVAQERLTELPGIGRALAGTIAELARTGRSEMLERRRASLPTGMLELRQVPGMTLRRVTALQDALAITSIAELKAACLAGRVRTVKGFGEKVEQRLLRGIEQWESRSDGVLLHHAEREGQGLFAFVRSVPGVIRAELAGGLRRCTETVERLSVAVAIEEDSASKGYSAPEGDASDGETEVGSRALAQLVRYPPAVAVVERTPSRCTLRLASGLLADVATSTPSHHAALLLALTGSPAHHARLQEIARAREFLLDHRGLTSLRTGDRLPAATEAELYQHLGLPYIPPELREDVGEIEAALAGTLPTDLVQEADIQGMVHCHTVWSDGKSTIEEMARAAAAMGMRYLTITDHSPTAHYAGGVTEDRLRAQWDEIARVQETVEVKLLRGTESDILADGSLDYPDHVLAQMDVVIASIHNRHQMDAEQMTKRLVAAMRNPFFKIWGHALGRYVTSRPPIECRVEEVLDAAAQARVAIEVNGDPHRLDLEPRWQREARRRGIPFVISTDAHSIGQLQNLRFGVAMARRGWVRRHEVLNTLGADEFCAAVRP